MKFGIRKPNIKSSIKARTTGKVKRIVEKTINPVYGKKGIGYITNPKKAIYNKVYNKTSISAIDLFKKSNNLLYIVFIALPCSCIIFIFQLMYYFVKYLILGMIWIIKKLFSLFRKGENEE